MVVVFDTKLKVYGLSPIEIINQQRFRTQNDPYQIINI